jgi:DNA-binding CsgD family transcriptional regulator
LSAREVEALRLVANGQGDKEIANALNFAEGAVKPHVSHALEKLSVKDRTEAATVALQRGISRWSNNVFRQIPPPVLYESIIDTSLCAIL